MDTRIVGGAHPRAKPLVACLCAALALGTSVVATPAFAGTSRGAREHALAHRFASDDPLAARVASILATRPPPRPGGAAIPVTNCNDGGSGSLRDAVENVAVSGDTVDMTGLSCSTITLTSGAIVASMDDLTIIGPGADMYGVTIDANHASEVFLHVGTGTLRLKYMTALNGGKYTSGDADALGGCIYSTGQVDLLDSGVKYCVAEAQGTGGARGGGVYATLGLSASVATIGGNSARGGYAAGGGVFARNLVSTYSWFRNNEAGSTGGAIMAIAEASVNTSTISGNSASLVGGIHLLGYGATKPLEISQSTITDNYSADPRFGAGVRLGSAAVISNSTITGNVARGSAKYGAGIQIGPSASLTLHSTIVSGNTLYDGTTHLPDDIGIYGAGIVSGGAGNLVGYAPEVLEIPPDTIFTSDPGLGGLLQNGGPTPTMLPLAGSLAIDNGHNIYSRSFDQRGPGYPRVLGAFTDVGAVESTEDPGNDVIFANGFD